MIDILTTSNIPTEAFNKLRLIKQEEVEDYIAFINIIIKAYYNSKYKKFNTKVNNKVFLYLYYSYKILGIINYKLS